MIKDRIRKPIDKDRRKNTGFSLVEALITLVLAALVSAAFIDLYVQLMRTNTATQNEICANMIASEMLEASHGFGYTVLANNQGTHDLLLTRTPLKPTGPPIRVTPTVLDTIDKIWNSKVASNNMVGKATYIISPVSGASVINGAPSALKVTTIVQWSDSARPTTIAGDYGRTITSSFVITQTGVNKWTH